MTMKTKIMIATSLFALALVTGCDKTSEEAKAPEAAAPAATVAPAAAPVAAPAPTTEAAPAPAPTEAAPVAPAPAAK